MSLAEADRYVLGPAIAGGGMGTVHVARLRGAEGFSRVVAIKCLRTEFAADAEHIAMFVDEALLASRIRHANVVPTIDVCRAGRDLWIVMDYAAGESLARLILGGPLRADVAHAIFHDVLAGLEGAHLATDVSGAPLGLVHRDVSPQNILIGADGVARIADFGIAKARNRAPVTKEGEFKGKIGYAAPEVVQGFPATEAADVYGTGVTLWETLVGQRLFVGENESAVLYKVLEWAPPLVSVAAPHVGTAYDAVVARALAKDPTARFASAREMLDALDAAGARASAREVARVLEASLGSVLRERSALVRAFETGVPLSPRPTPDANEANIATQTVVTPPGAVLPPQTPLGTVRMLATAPAAPTKDHGPLIALAMTLGVAIVVAAAIVVVVRRPAATPAVTTPITGAPAPVAPASDTARLPIMIPDLVDPPVPSAAPSAAPPPPASAPSAPAKPPAPKKTKCDPPWTIDGDGMKHYKPECLR